MARYVILLIATFTFEYKNTRSLNEHHPCKHHSHVNTTRHISNDVRKSHHFMPTLEDGEQTFSRQGCVFSIILVICAGRISLVHFVIYVIP